MAMLSPDQPVLRDIVLIGGGHSHVGVLRRFGMHPVPGVRLSVICRDTHTPYSGMLPGYIAGHYSYDEVHIDLSRLARFAGARLFRDEALGLDRDAGKVLCRNRPPVPYDYLSINIGSTPQMSNVPGATEHAVPVKPINGFNQRWLLLLERVRQHAGAMRIAVVGGGAGGVELALGDAVPPAPGTARSGAQPGRASLPPAHQRSGNPAHPQRFRAPRIRARAGRTRCRLCIAAPTSTRYRRRACRRRAAKAWMPTKSSGSRAPAARRGCARPVSRWMRTASFR